MDLEDENDENMKSNRGSQGSLGIRNGNRNLAFVKYKIESKAEKRAWGSCSQLITQNKNTTKSKDNAEERGIGRIDVADVKSMMDTRQFFNELK